MYDDNRGGVLDLFVSLHSRLEEKPSFVECLDWARDKEDWRKINFFSFQLVINSFVWDPSIAN